MFQTFPPPAPFLNIHRLTPMDGFRAGLRGSFSSGATRTSVPFKIAMPVKYVKHKKM